MTMVEERVLSSFRSANIITRLSTATYHVKYAADPNIGVILSLDHHSFTPSTFCSSAYEWNHLESDTSRRLRIYPTANKIMVMGCKSLQECKDTLVKLRHVLGTLHILNIQCILLNLNLNLPWTMNRHVDTILSEVPEVVLVEARERQPCLVVHVRLHNSYIKKALLYPRTGKASLHTSSWEDTEIMWSLLWPALQQCRGFSKPTEPG